ncbi:MAG: GntR family transcriptional regulator [Yoonia sp.]|jgi:GntR family transcriptional regulator
MNKNRFDNKLSQAGLAFQPLYKQVEEYVTQLIVEQRWKPGKMLPNEFQLAEELGVSQGTVRKALNGLTAAQILTRRQGVGTFVSEHTNQHSLYRFYPIICDGKAPELPKAELLSLNVIKSSKVVASALGIKANTKVFEILRRRILNNEFCIFEKIYLPYIYFKALEGKQELPHTLYHFYQTKFNLTVQDTTDSIKADIASAEDAKLLGIHQGDALLEVQRLARTIDGKKIEFRISRCRSDNYHYLVESK